MNLYLKALVSRFVAQRDEALANLDNAFAGANALSVEEQMNFVRDLVEAEAAIAALKRNFDSVGIVREQPGEAMLALVFDEPHIAETILDDMDDTLEAIRYEEDIDGQMPSPLNSDNPR